MSHRANESNKPPLSPTLGGTCSGTIRPSWAGGLSLWSTASVGSSSSGLCSQTSAATTHPQDSSSSSSQHHSSEGSTPTSGGGGGSSNGGGGGSGAMRDLMQLSPIRTKDRLSRLGVRGGDYVGPGSPANLRGEPANLRGEDGGGRGCLGKGHWDLLLWNKGSRRGRRGGATSGEDLRGLGVD